MLCELCNEKPVQAIERKSSRPKPICGDCADMVHRLSVIWGTLSPEAQEMLQDMHARMRKAKATGATA